VSEDDHGLLTDLIAIWGSSYSITLDGGQWKASRHNDPDIELLATSARVLRELIQADFAGRLQP
jgi:hypothetical protein